MPQPTESDERFPEAVHAVQRVAEDCGIPVLLVGAYARDLLLRRLGVEGALRRTRDVDFGVKVSSWEDFGRFKEALVKTGSFQAQGAEGPHQRLMFQGRMEIDLVPFGDLAGNDGRLSCWPDDFCHEMTVAGYEDALRQADRVLLGDREIRTASLESLVVLKFLSWNDQPQDREKDAVDIAHLLKNLGSMPRVVEEVFSAEGLDSEDGTDDFDRRCHRWLGRRIAAAFEDRAIGMLLGILDREIESDETLLARQMRPSYREPTDALAALECLREGLQAAREADIRDKISNNPPIDRDLLTYPRSPGSEGD